MTNLKKAGLKAVSYTVAVATILWAVGLGALVPSASAATLSAGDLIKGSGAAVYLYNADNTRSTFTNEKVFKTWYSDFTGTKSLTDAELAAISLSRFNATYRPGTRLVKITTDPKVYAVEPGGVLRWITSETIAKDLFGDNWNQQIDDVSDAFFGNYFPGNSVTTSTPTNGMLVKTADSADIYYVDAAGRRKIQDFSAFVANGFQSQYIRTVSSAVMNSVAMATGTQATITARETNIAIFTPPTSSTPTPTPTPTPATGTGLSVALASDTPASGSIIADAANGGQALANMMKLNFTAGADGDVKVSKLTLKRIGIASDSDINNAYLYADGKRLAEVQSISNGTLLFNGGTAGLFTVAKGTTTGLWVKMDVSKSATSGKTIGFSLNSGSDVDAGTSVVTTGSFPINGNLMSVATITDLGLLTVSSVSPAAATTATAQDDYDLWKFNLQASNQKINVTYLAFTNIGSTSATDIVNFELFDGSTKLGSTVASMDADKRMAFDLSAAPLVIPSGVTKQLTLRGDIKSGATRTWQMSLQKSSDVQSMDDQYKVSLFPFPQGGTVGLWNVVQAGGATTINAGTLTTSKGTDSPTTEIVASGTNVLLATWDLKAAGEDIKVSTATFTPTISSNRTLKNVKMLYEDVQVGTQVTTVTGGTDFAFTLGNSMVVKADGANHKIKLVGDTTGTAVAADTVLMTFKLGAGNGQGTNSLSAVNVPGANSAANTVTLRAGSLTPSRVGVTAATFVANTSNVSLGQWSVQAGAAENVDVNSITIKDSNSAGTANGANGLGSAFNNLELYVNGVKAAQTITSPSATAGTTNTFNLSPAVLVTSTTPVTFEVKGQVLSGATWTATNAIGVTAIAGTGKTTSSATPSYAATLPASTVGPAITIATGGTLAVSVDTSGAAASQFYTAGLADQEFARLRFAAANEDIKLSKLVLRTVVGTSNIQSLKLTGTGLATDPTATVDSSGNATFNFATGSELMITKDTSKVVTVKGTLGTLGAIVAGNLGVVQFGTADAVGSSSGNVVQETPAGTVCTAGTACGTLAAGDLVYFTVAGDGASTLDNTPGYRVVTTVTDNTLVAAAGIELEGENAGVANASWATGDKVTEITAITNEVDADNDSDNALAVGDLVYFYGDTAGTNNSASTGFHVVTTATAANTGTIVLDGANVVVDAGDIIVRLTNTNGMGGNSMKYEEVEAVATVAAGSPSGTVSPNSEQTVATFDVKASGLRDMTLSGFTVEKQGSNSPERYVTRLSLWNGATKLSEVANTTVAATSDGTAGNADTTIILVTGAATAAGEVSVTAARAASIQAGDKLTIVPNGTAAATTTATVVTKAGTIGATTVSTLTLTFDATVTIPADATTVDIRNFRVHFDAAQINTGDIALAPQTVTQGSTTTLTVKADTTAVKTGVTSGTVTFGVSLPGTTGPLTTNVGGLTWTYTVFGAGAAHTGTTADGYPVNANTLSY